MVLAIAFWLISGVELPNSLRNYRLPGSHYLGRITPKRLQSEKQKAELRTIIKERMPEFYADQAEKDDDKDPR